MENIFQHNGGTGLMGCYNLSILEIDLLELTGGWPEKNIEFPKQIPDAAVIIDEK